MMYREDERLRREEECLLREEQKAEERQRMEDDRRRNGRLTHLMMIALLDKPGGEALNGGLGEMDKCTLLVSLK